MALDVKKPEEWLEEEPRSVLVTVRSRKDMMDALRKRVDEHYAVYLPEIEYLMGVHDEMMHVIMSNALYANRLKIEEEIETLQAKRKASTSKRDRSNMEDKIDELTAELRHLKEREVEAKMNATSYQSIASMLEHEAKQCRLHPHSYVRR